MPNPTIYELVSTFFDRALESPSGGILIHSTNVFLDSRLLYQIRNEIGNPEYWDIEIDIGADPEREIILIRKDARPRQIPMEI